MDAETLADLNKLDAVVRQLGIGESFIEPVDAVAKLQEDHERLVNACSWVSEVHPGTVPRSGGANVHMTWDQWNELRAALRLKPQYPIK